MAVIEVLVCCVSSQSEQISGVDVVGMKETIQRLEEENSRLRKVLC